MPLPASLSYMRTNHGVLGELSSARDEEDDAVVIGAGLYKNAVLFQM